MAEESCCGPMFWVYLLICVALVMFAGLMSGLTLGLMSLSLMDLEVLVKAGQPEDQKSAGSPPPPLFLLSCLYHELHPLFFLHPVFFMGLCFLVQPRFCPSSRISICCSALFSSATPWPWRSHPRSRPFSWIIKFDVFDAVYNFFVMFRLCPYFLMLWFQRGGQY